MLLQNIVFIFERHCLFVLTFLFINIIKIYFTPILGHKLHLRVSYEVFLQCRPIGCILKKIMLLQKSVIRSIKYGNPLRSRYSYNCGLDNPVFEFRQGQNIFFSSKTAHISSEAHPASNAVGTGILSRR